MKNLHLYYELLLHNSFENAFPEVAEGTWNENPVVDNQEIRFGIIAVEKGFITPGQLGKAVNIQMRDDLKRGQRRRIGDILVDMGFMTFSQVTEVVEIQSFR